jgi:hypothetical protein
VAAQSYRAEGALASSTATENHDVHHLVHNHTPHPPWSLSATACNRRYRWQECTTLCGRLTDKRCTTPVALREKQGAVHPVILLGTLWETAVDGIVAA